MKKVMDEIKSDDKTDHHMDYRMNKSSGSGKYINVVYFLLGSNYDETIRLKIMEKIFGKINIDAFALHYFRCYNDEDKYKKVDKFIELTKLMSPELFLEMCNTLEKILSTCNYDVVQYFTSKFSTKLILPKRPYGMHEKIMSNYDTLI